jgi:hypothetical protein
MHEYMAFHHILHRTLNKKTYQWISIMSIILYIRLDTNGAHTNICTNICLTS